MSKKTKTAPVYSERLQMLLDLCDRYRAYEKKLEEQGVECDDNCTSLEVDNSRLNKPGKRVKPPQ